MKRYKVGPFDTKAQADQTKAVFDSLNGDGRSPHYDTVVKKDPLDHYYVYVTETP